MTTGKPYRPSTFALICLVLLLIGCAKSMSPPGGPRDITPPEYVESIPKTGSLRVSPDVDVLIRFSEKIDPQSVARAVFITPQPDPPAEIKARGDAIDIKFPEKLKPDRTYIINIGTDLKDAHRVSLAQSVTVSFSTGESIDSGSISGRVFKDNKGAGNISLALFEELPDSLSRRVDSLAPTYLTQSGQGGSYKFEYLPPGKYYLAAFEDKNKNRRINPDQDIVGLPYRELILTPDQDRIENIDVRLHKADTGLVEIRSVSVNPDELVKVRFSRSLNREEAGSLISETLIESDRDSLPLIEISAFTNLNPYPSTDFLLATTSLTAGEKYHLIFDLKTIYDDLSDSLSTLSYEFTAPEITDTRPPELLDTEPPHNAENVRLDRDLWFLFSEPVDSADLPAAFSLVSCTGDTLAIDPEPVDLFLYQWIPDPVLQFGCKYRILIDEKSVRDRRGIKMGDSLAIVEFTTIGRDTLGQLSGVVSFTSTDDTTHPVMVEFRPIADGRPQDKYLETEERQFRFEFLPGYYSISAFLDRNGNSTYDYGSILPYQLAEPFTTVSDTFRVRTRFETTGIEIEF